MHRFFPLAAVVLCLTLASGCRSAFVEATVSNRTDKPILLLEVDYPSASFGTENLAPGATFHYRFKVLGSGEMKVLYTDSQHKDHVAKGPSVQEGARGSVEIDLAPDGAHWKMVPKG